MGYGRLGTLLKRHEMSAKHYHTKMRNLDISLFSLRAIAHRRAAAQARCLQHGPTVALSGHGPFCPVHSPQSVDSLLSYAHSASFCQYENKPGHLQKAKHIFCC
jgi:hypothetical protein